MKFQSVMQWFRALKPARDHAVRDDAGQAALVIITVVIIAAGVAISQTQLMNSRRGLEVTQAQRANFKLIKDAIEVAAIQDANFLLPCPSDPTIPGSLGTSVGNNGTICNLNRGIVPWTTLGLPRSSAIDPQGNYITYIVDNTNISVCNGENARVGTLNEAEGGTDFTYALISHGENGFGGYNSNSGNQTQIPTSALELDNCPNPSGAGCDPGTNNEFRAGPFDETDGTSEFDDIVRAVQASETFTVECPVINEDETEVVGDTGISLTSREASTAMTGTSNDAILQTRAMSTTTDTSTSETITQLGFTGSTTANASAACDWFESPVRFQDSVVRMYQEFGMLSDAGDVRGNGIVLALMSYDPAIYRLSTTNRNFICGGTDGDMGFANDPVVANRNLPDVPRMGIEIDTESHFDGSIPVDPATFNKDNALDHVAIVNGNVDHMGSRVTIDSSTHGDGPICVDEITPGEGDLNPGTANGNSDLQGCTPVELEIGSNTGNPVQDDFHRLRVEMHYETDTDSVCSDLGFVSDYAYVAYWLYTSSGSGIPSCPENPGTCSDLTQDYAETPTGRFCIPWSSAAGDEFVRYGLTTGAAAVGGAGRDEIRVQKIGVGSARMQASTSDFPMADPTERSGEINNIVAADEYEAVVTGLSANNGGLASGDLNNTENTESGLIDLPSQGAKLVSGRGTITVNYGNTNDGTPEELWDGEGIGVIGVGNVDNNAIGNYWERTVDNDPPTADLGVYLDTSKDESLTVEFDERYSRMTFNLGEFSDINIPDGADGVSGDQIIYERVIVRAYDSTSATPDTPVHEETISACTTNTSNGHHMTVSLDLSANPSDKITFIPRTATLLATPPVENRYGSEFWLRGIQACGMDAPCGVLAETDCFVYDGAAVNTFPTASYPYGGLGAGSGTTGDITIESVQTDAGGPDYLRFEGNGETPWLYLEDSGVDIYANGVDVYLDEHNTAGQLAREGFSVDNTTIASNLGESISFLFHNTWEEVALSIGKFGRVGGSGASLRVESVQVQGFRNGSAVTAITTVAACHTDFGDAIDSNSNNGSKSFNLDFNQAIDQIVITPTTTTPQSTSASQIVVRGIEGCDGTAACALANINGAGNDCSGGTIVVPSL
ncbi:MAG: hypothetical protein RIF37_14125 [Rhodospirillaceae bacterium]